MKTFVICTPEIKESAYNTKINVFNFCNTNIPVCVFHIEEQNSDAMTGNNVMVKVNAFSCNYRDRTLFLSFNKRCNILSGNDYQIYSPFGSEFVAEVIKIGPDVKTLKEGDRVIPDCHYNGLTNIVHEGVTTNYASQRIHVFNENKLIKIPESMPDEIAASFSIASQTAYSMKRKALLNDDCKVLVTSATSNTSLAITRTLRHENVSIYVTSSDEKNEKKLLDIGLDRFIPLKDFIHNNSKERMTDVQFDIVFDPFFDLNLNGIVNYIRHNGKYIYCGLCEQYERLDRSLLLFSENYKNVLTTCLIKNISIIGNCLGLRSDLEMALRDYCMGKYDIIIDSVYSGQDLLPFLERSFKSVSRFGKVVYKYND